MYNNIKLEKNLYNLAGKSFTQALSDLDPDSGYANTELFGLDAFERQLKRFDIKVSGANSDMVEKFFQTTESAVLFPEFVKREIKQGMNSAVLPEIAAATTSTHMLDYRGFSVNENKVPYSTATAPGAALPETTITLDTALVSLSKFGRVITASYEAIRQQRLDAFGVTLRAIGAQIARAVIKQAVEVLTDGVTPLAMTGSVFNYAELAAFWSKFGEYNMTTVLASPATIASILAFDQMKYACHDFMETGMVKTPFGTTLVKSSAVADNVLIGLDKSCALEMVNGSDVILEIDKLLDRQMDRTVVSITTGFTKIIPDAVKVLSIA